MNNMYSTCDLLQVHRERKAMLCVGFVAGLALGLILLVLMLVTAHAAHAQTFTGVRAVAFPSGGGSCYYRNLLPTLSTSSIYEGSIWVDGNAVIAPGSQETLSASNYAGNPTATNVMQVQIFNSTNDPNLTNGLHLLFYTSDGTTGANSYYNQWVSNELVSFPNPWNHAYITSDTSGHFSNGNYTVVVFWNGVELTPNAHYTHGNTNEMPPYSVFSTPWSKNGVGNVWLTGCYQNPISGVFSSFYTGGMAEDYETVLGPSDVPALFSLGRFSPSTGIWQPQELGPMCLNPRPGNPAPTKCQRGGASGITTNAFPYNLFPILSAQFNRFGPATPLALDDPFVANQ